MCIRDRYSSVDTSLGYESIPMGVGLDANSFWVDIPSQSEGTEVFYYFKATANDGKTIVRPLPAPAGYFKYSVKDCTVNNENLLATALEKIKLETIYPNPTGETAIVPVTSENAIDAEIIIVDALGRTVKTIFNGQIPQGLSNHFIHVNELASGSYFVTLKTEGQQFVQKLGVK